MLNGDKKSLSVNDVLAIYSATKLITAVATLQCVEKGLFKLDEDISRILPHFKTVQVITGFDGDKPQFEEKKKAVTLRLVKAIDFIND